MGNSTVDVTGGSMFNFRIDAAQNGYVLEYDDPATVKKNRSDDGYEDPTRRRIYTTLELLIEDLPTLVDTIKMAVEDAPNKKKDEFDDALTEALNEQD